MYLAWRHGGNDPFRLFHNLTDDYRPLGEPEADPVLPLHPDRVQKLIYGFGLRAAEEAAAAAGAGMGG